MDSTESTKVPDDVSEDETISLNVVYHVPEGLQLTFSDNVAVQHTPSEFTLTFSQIQQPLVTKADDFDSIDSITAEVVARIVLTPTKMVELIEFFANVVYGRIIRRRFFESAVVVRL